MILSNHIYKKIFLSTFICITICFMLFYIFSLLGNLGGNNNFKITLLLSLLSSLQIFFYVPIFIFFLIFLIFLVIIKSHNELFVIMHYIPKKRLFKYFLAIIFIFAYLEINKDYYIDKIEEIKSNSLNLRSDNSTNIIIHKNIFEKVYYVVTKKTYENHERKNINIYKIKDGYEIEALYSNQIQINKNHTTLSDSFNLVENKITNIKEDIKLPINLNKFIEGNNKIIHLNKKKLNINMEYLLNISTIVISLFALMSILTRKKNIQKKNENNYSYIFSIFIIFYSYLMLNINLSFYNQAFNFLSVLFLILVFINNSLYE